MRRAVALLTLLLLLLPVALAEEKVIHEAWHPYQDFFSIGEDYYEVINDHRLDDNEVRIQTLIKRNQASYIITATADEPDDDSLYTLAEERCKSEGIYRYCVTDISLDPKNEARSDEAGRYRYGTHIKIYEEIPETALLEVTKTFATSTLFYQEETKVTVTIKNKGTLKATNINYNESLGEGLLITRYKDYDYRLPTKLKKTIPELYPDDQVSFQYWVQAIDYVNQSTATSSITYDNPDPSTLTKADTITITWPYKSSFSLSKTDADINDPIILSYTITNNENNPLESILSITLDQGIIVGDVGDFERAENKLLYEETLEPQTETILHAELYSEYTGKYNVSTNLEVAVNDRHFNVIADSGYVVTTDTITPSIVLSKTKTRSEEPVTIGFYIKNEDEETPFFNIEGWVGSDFFNQTFSLDALPKGYEKNVIFKPYFPPSATNETVDHIIGIGGTFQTQNGEQQSFYTERTITVIPKNMSILLTKTATPTSVKRGEEVTVTVEAENIADSGSNFVRSYDEYDDALEKSFGTTQGETFMYPGETRQLYVYKLRIPYDYTKHDFTINSSLTAKGQSLVKVIRTIEVTDPLDPNEVSPPVIEEPETHSESGVPEEPGEKPETPIEPSEPEVTPETPEEQEDEKGVFSKIINGVAEFFANFFS